MDVQEKLYTADDLWELSHQGKRYELIKGVLVEMTPTGDEHGITAMWFGHLILAHVDEHDLGKVTAAETGFTLSGDPYTVLAPDIGFISKARLQPLTGGYFTIPPDLAVEVVSPGDRASEIHDKVHAYLDAGTKAVWVLYPSSQTIAVHTGEGSRTLSGDDMLDGGGILPGFRVKVSEVFKKLRD